MAVDSLCKKVLADAKDSEVRNRTVWEVTSKHAVGAM